MESNLVSVIVPVYKVEKELPRCLESIIKQSYKNIEIILVDDGSPDNCPNICDFYGSKDIRIKVFHKENGGLSSARNYGLDRSLGNYIAFIDGDDWVESEFIETLVSDITKIKADIAIIGYSLIWDNGKVINYTTGNEYEIFGQNQAIHELLAQKKFHCMVCTKLYKKELFDNIRFPEGKLYEDIAISLAIFKQCKKVVFNGKHKYFYYQRENSIANSKFDDRKLSMLDYCEMMINYSKSKGGIFDKEAYAFYLKAAMMLMLQAFDTLDSPNIKETIKFMLKEIKKKKKYILFNPYIEIRRQIVLWAMIVHISPRLLNKLWKVKVSH